MDCLQPWCLLLIPALALLLWWGVRRSLVPCTPFRLALCTALRALILGLLVLALAGLRLHWPVRELGVVFLVDASASISEGQHEAARRFLAESLAARSAGDQVAIAAFAAKTVLWANQPDGVPDAPLPDVGNRTRTDYGAALEFARALLPADRPARVVLLSDGNDTEGRGTEAACALADAGVEIFTVPLAKPHVPEVLVESVDVRGQPRAGEPFTATVRIRSNVAGKTRVRLLLNQFVARAVEETLAPGVTTVSFENLRAEGTLATLEAEVEPEADAVPQNNRAALLLTLAGAARVLLVDAQPEKAEPLAAALRAQHIAVEVRGTTGLPATLADLQAFDLLVLSDVPAHSVSNAQMELFQRWVRDLGGGLLMAGGENSFGAGGWFRTPVEQMLPVRMEHADRVENPTVALLVILDRSGSMAAQVEGRTKISLASQGAVLALDVLTPRDVFGLFAVDSRVHRVLPVGRVENRAAAGRKILALSAAGGGIYIYTSLVEAFRELRDLDAAVKHVILFADAADAEEKSAGEMGGPATGGTALDVAAAMLAARITTSVVALGLDSDKDADFLRRLAEAGGGRFYLTSDARSLPRIFTAETSKVTQSSLVEEPFRAVPGPVPARLVTPAIDWARAPLLLGYNVTQPKPGAELVLQTERGEPLLAIWRYGLGVTAAFASDVKARWAADWLGWADFGRFWSQVARAVMRSGTATGMETRLTREGDQVRVHVETMNADGTLDAGAAVTIHAAAPGQAAMPLQVVQTAPGIFEAVCSAPTEEGLLFSIANTAENRPAVEVVGYRPGCPREFLETEVQPTVLERLAADGRGVFNPLPAEVFTRPRRPQVAPVDLTAWLLMIALVLLPLDILLRRSM